MQTCADISATLVIAYAILIFFSFYFLINKRNKSTNIQLNVYKGLHMKSHNFHPKTESSGTNLQSNPLKWVT